MVSGNGTLTARHVSPDARHMDISQRRTGEEAGEDKVDNAAHNNHRQHVEQLPLHHVLHGARVCRTMLWCVDVRYAARAGHGVGWGGFRLLLDVEPLLLVVEVLLAGQIRLSTHNSTVHGTITATHLLGDEAAIGNQRLATQQRLPALHHHTRVSLAMRCGTHVWNTLSTSRFFSDWMRMLA